LSFAYEREGIVGTVSINLDQRDVRWDVSDYHDSETGATDVVTLPVACGQLIVRIQGLYDSLSISQESSSSSEALSGPFAALFAREPPRYSPADLRFLAVAHNLAVEYASKFVDFVNTELGQYWVNLGHMPEWGMWYFYLETGARWVDSEDGGHVIADGWLALEAEEEEPAPPAFYYQAKGLDETHWRKMQHSLESVSPPDLSNRLILNAKRHLASGNYRMATVEGVAALEVKLASFIKRRSQEKGVSNSTWKTYSAQLGIAMLLRLLWPIVLEKDELKTWLKSKRLGDTDADAIVQQCLDLNGLRNHVVHDGADPSSGTEIIELGIQAVEKILEFIQETEENGS